VGDRSFGEPAHELVREQSADGLFLPCLRKNGYCRLADRTARPALLFSPDAGDGAESVSRINNNLGHSA